MARFIFFLILLSCISCKKHKITNENTEIGDTFYTKGSELFQRNDIEAYKNFQKAISYYKLSHDSSNISKALIFQANIQNNKGDYMGAEETLVEALTYMKENDSSFYSLYGTMANIKFDQKEYKEAIKWSDKTLSESNIEYDTKARLLNNKAVAFSKLKDYKNALKTLEKIILDSIQKKNTIYTIKDNKEYFHWLFDNTYDVQNSLEEILKIKISQNDSWGMNSSYSHLSDIYKDKNSEKSLVYAKQMLITATKNKSPVDRLEALEKILVVDTPNNAKKLFNQYKILSDSIQLSRNNYSNRFAYIKYDSEKSNADNQRLKADNSQKQNNILLLLVALIFAIIIIIWFRKRQINLKFEVKNTALKYSKKVHDKVANKVYHVMSEVENTSNIDKNELLDKLENIYHISRDISYEDKDIAIEKDFSKQLSQMLKSYSSDIIKVPIIGNEEELWNGASETAKIETFYILQELMTNMKKHSKADRVIIDFERENNIITIAYSDNGVGMHGYSPKNGLKNTESRINSIGGTINFETTTEKGLKISLSFPAKK
ncbi:hypothetical protein C1637_01485 [Chryseobacterium lactis]|uniref:histidine kinase n=1 Tax=Chryseobacterium lactis TaxID=1241981 RepID=A0A3G6RN04_CHRLC|nr:tetratricopeptide repeat-containing sensor histidine kinase [Chryseobacterium lactis]AZA81275.1 tetratricopeptide repeat-containing sensor histidine kinase [Chryseobacterium lactis]AZB06275.1 tetratricopeptide repeat-containing sensor histidine kinase [Chryseobacterium lactis]PNW15127.1 hypothetical protein C1637_01485 [Chryseobacterium lactis]